MLIEPIQTKGNCFCAHFPDNFENVQGGGSGVFKKGWTRIMFSQFKNFNTPMCRDLVLSM